jgi:hypothetical protein
MVLAGRHIPRKPESGNNHGQEHEHPRECAGRVAIHQQQSRYAEHS